MEPHTGAPSGARERDDRRPGGLVAAVGGTAAAATVLAFYAPGMLASGSDPAGVVLILSLPVVAMVLPFALMVFVRALPVLVVSSALLAFALGSVAWDLFTGPPDPRGESLVVFAVLIVVNFSNAVTALVVSGGYRAARRRSRPW